MCIRFEKSSVFASRFGITHGEHWGISNPWTGDLAVAPMTPTNRRFDVLAHELAHLRLGSTDEHDTDLLACEWGATWVHYIDGCP